MKKKKYNNGGPISVESLAVKPPIIRQLKMQIPSIPAYTVPAIYQGNTEHSAKSKSKNRFREKSMGGQLLQAGVSFIPGVGQILAPLVGMVDQQNEAAKAANEAFIQDRAPLKVAVNPYGQMAMGGTILPKNRILSNQPVRKSRRRRNSQLNPAILAGIGVLGTGIVSALDKDKQQPSSLALSIPAPFSTPVATSTNQGEVPYISEAFNKVNTPDFVNVAKYGGTLESGRYKNGGILNDMFKQYKTGSHQQGNDLLVDEKGLPDPNGLNTVQNKENSYTIDGQQYVFSDTLGGKEKFNTQAMNINKKYPKARFNLDQRQALDLEMKLLSKENDIARIAVEGSTPTQMAYGGPILNKAILDASNYFKSNQSVTPDQVPLADPNMFVNPTDPKLYTPQMPEEYKGIEMATNTTQVVPESQITLGKDLTAPGPTPINPTQAVTNRDVTGILDPKAANAVGLGLKGLALAGSVKDAFSSAENERPILPNYDKSDAYLKSANIDYTQARQDVTGASNIGAGINRSLSGSASQFQGREQARIAQLQDALSRVSMGEGNAQSQLNLTKGEIENSRALDTSNRLYQNQQGNMQNQANQRYAGRMLSSDLASIGSSFNSYASTQQINNNNRELNTFQVNQQIALLNSRFPNIKVTPEIMDKIKQGASIDEIIKVSI